MAKAAVAVGPATLGNDGLWGGDGQDTLSGGQGTACLHGGTGTDNPFGGREMDAFQITDDHATDTIFCGAGRTDNDQMWFSNFQSTQGHVFTFTGNEAGTYAFGKGLATGSFTDNKAASASSVAQNLTGNPGNDTLTTGDGADTVFLGIAAAPIR